MGRFKYAHIKKGIPHSGCHPILWWDISLKETLVTETAMNPMATVAKMISWFIHVAACVSP